MPEGFDPASIDAIGINRDGTWIYATQKEEASAREQMERGVRNINPYLTDAELAELKEPLKGTRAALVWSQDEAGCGYIVELFDEGQRFRGVMHPRTALEMLRGRGPRIDSQIHKPAGSGDA
jgi:hypothetical protein